MRNQFGGHPLRRAGEAAAIVRTFESEHEDWNPEELPGERAESG